MFLTFWLAASAAAPSLASIQERMALLAIPDTVEYRSTTSLRMEGASSTVAMHVIQAGSAQRRVELDATGHRSLLLTHDGRTVVMDPASRRTLPVPGGMPGTEQQSDLRALAGGRWREPIALDEGLWLLEEVSPSAGAVRGRSLLWHDETGEVRSLTQIGWNMDTTRIEFEWIRSEGRLLPSETKVVQALRGKTIQVDVRYSDWRFPRSLPPALFTNP